MGAPGEREIALSLEKTSPITVACVSVRQTMRQELRRSARGEADHEQGRKVPTMIASSCRTACSVQRIDAVIDGLPDVDLIRHVIPTGVGGELVDEALGVRADVVSVAHARTV